MVDFLFVSIPIAMRGGRVNMLTSMHVGIWSSRYTSWSWLQDQIK